MRSSSTRHIYPGLLAKARHWPEKGLLREFPLSCTIHSLKAVVLHCCHVRLFDSFFTKFFWRSEATVAGVFERFGVSFVSSVLAGDRCHNGLFIVWEYMFVLIWSGLTYNTDFCTYGRMLARAFFLVRFLLRRFLRAVMNAL